MQIIEQSWVWVVKPLSPLALIETVGRVCYKSEHKTEPESERAFVKMIMQRKHESVIEHVVASVRFITNRGATHELVRHRLCSYSQESTRYVKYNNKMEFIRPVWWSDEKYSEERKKNWVTHMEESERVYTALLEAGDHPEQAREVLPNSLKTEIVVTANLREWRHIFELRCSKKAHPQIRELMVDCLKGFHAEIPVVFDDLAAKFTTDPCG